jgi:hypothetical protein
LLENEKEVTYVVRMKELVERGKREVKKGRNEKQGTGSK